MTSTVPPPCPSQYYAVASPAGFIQIRVAGCAQTVLPTAETLATMSLRPLVSSSLSTGLAGRMRRAKVCGRLARLPNPHFLRDSLYVPCPPRLKGLPETPPLKGYKP
jgi:hypothetical protein